MKLVGERHGHTQPQIPEDLSAAGALAREMEGSGYKQFYCTILHGLHVCSPQVYPM